MQNPKSLQVRMEISGPELKVLGMQLLAKFPPHCVHESEGFEKAFLLGDVSS